LLPASLTVGDSGGLSGRFDFSYGGEAVPLDGIGFSDRLGVLSGASREQLPAPAKPSQLGNAVVIGRFRDSLDLFSRDDGERGGWFASAVIV
jgi:hypothetical protein